MDQQALFPGTTTPSHCLLCFPDSGRVAAQPSGRLARRPVPAGGTRAARSTPGRAAQRTDTCFLLVLPLIPTTRGHRGLGFPSSTGKLFPFTKRPVISLAEMGGGTWRSSIGATLTREGKLPFQPPILQNTQTPGPLPVSLSYPHLGPHSPLPPAVEGERQRQDHLPPPARGEWSCAGLASLLHLSRSLSTHTSHPKTPQVWMSVPGFPTPSAPSFVGTYCNVREAGLSGGSHDSQPPACISAALSPTQSSHVNRLTRGTGYLWCVPRTTHHP